MCGICFWRYADRLSLSDSKYGKGKQTLSREQQVGFSSTDARFYTENRRVEKSDVNLQFHLSMEERKTKLSRFVRNLTSPAILEN